MDTIFTMETFISVVMIGYGIWMLFRSAQQLRTNIKLRNEYKNSHKDYEEVNVYTGFLIFFAIMMAAGIFLAFFPYVEDNVYYYRLAYSLIALIAVSMVMDTLVKRRVIFDDNGFLYEKAYYRYRSIMNVTRNKGLMKNMEISSTEEKRITISHKMGEAFDVHYDNWKNRKKHKK